MDHYLSRFAVHCVAMRHVDPSYRFRPDHRYGFLPEDDNRADPNAVLVVRRDQENRPVGYVAREFAPHLRRIMAKGRLETVDLDPSSSNEYKKTLQISYVSPAVLEMQKRMQQESPRKKKRVRFSDDVVTRTKTSPSRTNSGDERERAPPQSPPPRP